MYFIFNTERSIVNLPIAFSNFMTIGLNLRELEQGNRKKKNEMINLEIVKNVSSFYVHSGKKGPNIMDCNSLINLLPMTILTLLVFLIYTD